MKTILAAILVLTIGVLTPTGVAFSYGGGGGGGGGAGAGSETSVDRGNDKNPPDGYEVIHISLTSTGRTDTTQSTRRAIEHLESLPPEVREEINFFWITATGIYIGYKTGALSRGLQALIGALLGGGATAIKNIGKDAKDQSSVIRGTVQGAGVSQIPGGPIVQEGASRLLDKISVPSLSGTPPGGIGLGRTLSQ